MKAFLRSVFSTAVGVFVGSMIFLFVVPIALVLAFKFANRSGSEAIEKNSILHLHLDGTIVERHKPMELDFNFDYMGGRSILPDDHTMGLYELNRAIDFAAKDPRISGILIEFVNLEAGWGSATALRRHLESFAKSGKWIYAYGERMNEMNYYIASAATRIFMQPSGDLEFNGFAMSEPFVKGLLAKLDVEPRVFRVGRFKAAVEPLLRDDMSPENREQNQVLLGDLWSNLRSTVSKSAGIPEAKIDSIATNLEVVSVQDAVNAKLVHELVFEDELEDKLKEKTVGADKELNLVTPGRLLRDSKGAFDSPKKKGKSRVAVIFADGEIVSGVGGRDRVGSESLRAEISEAAQDEDVAAIVLRVNSPGGDALASDVIWREVRIADDDIPVVVSMGDVAASGGYYIASGSRYIFAEPTTITGSIGVFGLMFGTEKFFKNKAGVSFDRVSTHPHADAGSANRPISEFEAKMIQRQVEKTYNRFLDVVEEGRGFEKRADLEAIAEGRVWSGTRAKEIGLVDELGGLDAAIAKAAEYAELKDYEIELRPEERDPFRALFERFAGESAKLWLSPELLSVLSHLRATVVEPALALKSGVYARMPYDIRIQ